jgi:hypothetical protein
MDHQLLPESIAQQLAQVWAVHRTPEFVEYLRQTFGCEPRKPVRFAGIFCAQMIGGFLYPDLPAGPGPVIEGLWLTDDKGFRASSLDELLPAEKLESDNLLEVYDPSRGTCEPISSQPYLHTYARYLFCVRGDGLMYIEDFGYFAWCKKVGKLVVSDRAPIQDTRIATKVWQGRCVEVDQHADGGRKVGLT